MKLFLATLLLTLSLFAYHKGDTIHPKMFQKLKMQKDKLYIINFFASWCGSCKKELPLIKKVSREIDNRDVKIIGIDVDNKIEKALSFQKKMALNFPVINDSDNTIIKEFKAFGMPSIYYIKNSRVLDIITGAVPHIDKRLLSDIQKFHH